MKTLEQSDPLMLAAVKEVLAGRVSVEEPQSALLGQSNSGELVSSKTNR